MFVLLSQQLKHQLSVDPHILQISPCLGVILDLLQSRFLRQSQAVGVDLFLESVLGGWLEVVTLRLQDYILVGFFVVGDHGAIGRPKEAGLLVFGSRGGVAASHAVIGH